MKYFGNWKSADDVLRDFSDYDGKNPPPDFPKAGDFLFACYDTPSYEGYAFVLFEKDGKLFEVNASHCSCYGLEGQWTPDHTTWEALALRIAPDAGYWSGKYSIEGVAGAPAAFQRLVKKHAKVGA